MEAKCCDRCKAFFQSTFGHEYRGWFRDAKDLCKSCADDFLRWLSNIARAAPEPSK